LHKPKKKNLQGINRAKAEGAPLTSTMQKREANYPQLGEGLRLAGEDERQSGERRENGSTTLMRQAFGRVP